MKTTTVSGLTVKAGVKAGGLGSNNHNRGGLKVTTALKAGGMKGPNHNRRLLAL
jgi:hypothetical protein